MCTKYKMVNRSHRKNISRKFQVIFLTGFKGNETKQFAVIDHRIGTLFLMFKPSFCEFN